MVHLKRKQNNLKKSPYLTHTSMLPWHKHDDIWYSPPPLAQYQM